MAERLEGPDVERIRVEEFLKQALEEVPDLPEGVVEALTTAVTGVGNQVEAIKRAVKEASGA